MCLLEILGKQRKWANVFFDIVIRSFLNVNKLRAKNSSAFSASRT